MKPPTLALVILQGEDNCFYSILQPTLGTTKTLALKDGLSRMTADMPDETVFISLPSMPCDLISAGLMHMAYFKTKTCWSIGLRNVDIVYIE